MSLKDACVGMRDATLRELGFVFGRYALPRTLFQSVRNNTMCSIQRLDNMYRLAKSVEEKGLSGAIVECGVWKGGCAGVAASVVKEAGYKRRLHLFDSFEGLPEPTKDDGPEAKSYSGGRADGKLSTTGNCVGTQTDVKDVLFNRLSIDPAQVSFHIGWFQDTVPKDHAEVGPISLLRLDGDWYESTLICLKHLYPQVVSGGYVILDDYGHWEGCRKALEEYQKTERLGALSLVKIDYTGVYFVKA
jgi:O-methyltransferase